MTETINPLTNSQKLFLQRLLVAHVLTDEKAKDLYQSIQEKFANVVNNDDGETSGDDDDDDDVDQGYMGNDFEHCLGIINASLMPAFNLEIGTVSLPAVYNPDGNRKSSQDDEEEEEGRKKASSTPSVKYHAIVNRSNDDVAQNYAAARTSLGPHELAFFRKVLEKLVECGNEFLAEHEQQQQQQGSRKRNRVPVVGCIGALNKMDLINLRTELEGHHQGKLSIAQTEMALEIMESEGWLVPAAPPGEEDDNDNFDSDDDDDEQPKRKRKPSRKSLRGAYFSIGPRTFMELGEFLQNCGFPEERMPQSILHRS